MLKAAVTALAGVVVFLYLQNQALHKQLYENAREDAEADQAVATALANIAARLGNGSPTTTNPGGSTTHA